MRRMLYHPENCCNIESGKTSMTMAEPPVEKSNTLVTVISRESDASRPSLENRVAFQWEQTYDLLGYRHSTRRDRIILNWYADALRRAKAPAAALDVGCGYGNHLFMLNGMLGKPQDVRLIGINLDPNQLGFAKAFAEEVPGFGNCSFDICDIEKGLPFEAGTFDVVGMADVLEHMTDPKAIFLEMSRVTKAGGEIIISTPLRTSLFKTVARLANTVTGGKLYSSYYKGKNTELDEKGKPIMDVKAGHDHISEMSYGELLALARSTGLELVEARPMSIMSGSSFFDRHVFLLSAILFWEGVHDLFRFPSWAHSVLLRLRVAVKS
jgi:SAM-dependent methyltransferase